MVSPGGRARRAGGRAGRAARLDRRDPGLACYAYGSRRAGLAGTARGGRRPGCSAPNATIRRPKRRRRRRWASSYVRGQARAGPRPWRRRTGRLPGRRTAGRAARPRRTRSTAAMRAPGCVHALARLGDTAQAEAGPRLASSEPTATAVRLRIAVAVLRLAQDDPRRGAGCAAHPVLDGSAPVGWQSWLVAGVPAGRRSPGTRWATRPPRGRPWSVRSTWPSPTARCCGSCCTPRRACSSASARHAHRARRPDRRDPRRARPRTRPPARPGAGTRPPARAAQREARLRVLRYLPTHLSAPEIAAELSVSAQHGQDPHAQPVRQARHAPPGRSGRPRPRPAACSRRRPISVEVIRAEITQDGVMPADPVTAQARCMDAAAAETYWRAAAACRSCDPDLFFPRVGGRPRRPTRPRRPKRSARGARSGPSAWTSPSAPASRTGSGAA